MRMIYAETGIGDNSTKDKVRFTNVRGYGDDTDYVEADKWSGKCHAITHMGVSMPCPELNIAQCYSFVKSGSWRIIE